MEDTKKYLVVSLDSESCLFLTKLTKDDSFWSVSHYDAKCYSLKGASNIRASLKRREGAKHLNEAGLTKLRVISLSSMMLQRIIERKIVAL